MTTLKWLGPGYFGKNVGPGDDMPEIDKKRLEKFIKLGKVGTIAKAIDIEDIKSEKIKALEKENVGIKKQFNPLEKRCIVLENEINGFDKERVVLQNDITEAGIRFKDISENLKGVEKENADLKKKVAAFEKELADLVKVSEKKDK